MDGAHFFVLLFCSTCRVICYGRGSTEASQFPVSPGPGGANQSALNTHWKDTHRGDEAWTKCANAPSTGTHTHTVSESHTHPT